MGVLRQVSTVNVFLDQFGIFGADDSVLILESSKTVEVVQLIQFIKISDIAEINGLYIALHLIPQLGPIEPFVQLVQHATVSQIIQLPSVISSIENLLVAFGSLVHKLFGYASHVHTCASDAPL